MEQLRTLERLLENNQLCRDEEDKWIWSNDASGIFSVKSILRTSYFAKLNQLPPCLSVWNNKVPPRIQVFMWAVLKGKISVRCNLRRRGILELCPLCGEIDKSVDHLLCRCRFTGDV